MEVAIEKKYYTVQDQETLELLFNHIQNSEILALDTETTSLNPRTGKVVGWSVSGEEGVGFYLPTLLWNYPMNRLEETKINGTSTRGISKKLLSMLENKKLVLHNAAFDRNFILNDYGVDILQDIWVDTALLVHTVYEEGAFGYGNPFALKSIAIMNQEALGLDVEKAANQEQIELKDSIKANGGSVTKDLFEIYKADLPILSKYAAADTDLTLRICNLYLEKLKQENLEEFFFEEEVMPIYKEVTIPMEAYGIDLDMELLHQTKVKILKDLEENKKTVLDSLLKTVPAKKWVVDTAESNFPVSHKGTWAQYLVERYSLPLPKSASGKYSLTKKKIEELEDSPQKEFLLTGNADVLEDVEKTRISMQLWKEKNDGEYINIQSKSHLGEIIFDYMGIESKKKTASGRHQFDMDTIEELSGHFEWAENLRIYNKLLKIKSTYVDRFLEAAEDGRFYPYFKQNGTVSGRYGSDLQQLPKPLEPGQDVEILYHYTNLVRAFFVAGKGRKFIDDDYASLEPRIFASVAGDDGLKEIYHKGWDFYSTVAIKTEKLDKDKQKYPNGVSPDTKSEVFLKKIDPVKRNKAKAYSLGLAYGMSPYALAMTLGISQKEAQGLHEGYLNGFPKLREWIESSRKFVKANGYMVNKLGRVRHLPKVKRIYEKFQDNLMDWRYRKDLSARYGNDQVTKAYRDYRNGLNNCLNFQIQSMAASIVNRAALQINRTAKAKGFDALVVAQIHDQLVINIREDQAEEFAPIVQDIMENNVKLDGVPLIAEPEIANNLKDGH